LIQKNDTKKSRLCPLRSKN